MSHYTHFNTAIDPGCSPRGKKPSTFDWVFGQSGIRFNDTFRCQRILYQNNRLTFSASPRMSLQQYTH
jgi:hypothetical protein